MVIDYLLLGVIPVPVTYSQAHFAGNLDFMFYQFSSTCQFRPMFQLLFFSLLNVCFHLLLVCLQYFPAMTATNAISIAGKLGPFLGQEAEAAMELRDAVGLNHEDTLQVRVVAKRNGKPWHGSRGEFFRCCDWFGLFFIPDFCLWVQCLGGIFGFRMFWVWVGERGKAAADVLVCRLVTWNKLFFFGCFPTRCPTACTKTYEF